MRTEVRSRGSDRLLGRGALASGFVRPRRREVCRCVSGSLFLCFSVYFCLAVFFCVPERFSARRKGEGEKRTVEKHALNGLERVVGCVLRDAI